MVRRQEWRPLGPRRASGSETLSGTAPAAIARDSVNPVRELFDAAAQGYTLSFRCRGCGRVRTFHAAAVWRHFDRKGWSPWLRDVAARFRCRVCGRRTPQLELGHEEPTDTSLPLPDRYAWKRELSRRR